MPRGGVIWNPAPRVSVKALYSAAFRAPSLNETVLNYVPPPWVGGPSLKGNLNLSPEKVATVDLGVSYEGRRFQAGVGFFHSKQTDNIILTDVNTAGRYVNLGQAKFHGFEAEGKYYFARNFFLMGSALYQANSDDAGNRNVTPIANYGAKAGVSYDSPHKFSVGLFDVHQGPVHGYSGALNPRPRAYDLLNSNIRYDLSRHLPPNPRTSVALVMHADNLTNRTVWLPDWKDQPGDSIFYHRGRTIYIGVELSLRRE